MKLSKRKIREEVYKGIEIDNGWSILHHHTAGTMTSSMQRLYDYLERKGIVLIE